MDRRVNQDQLGIRVLQALHRPGATVSRTIVDDPEDAARIIVGRSRHDLLDQTVKGFDAVVGLAAAKDSGMVDIQRGDVGPGSTTKIFVLNLHRATRPTCASGVFAAAGLNTGLLVRRNYEFV